jgi:hypothetical protein
VTGGGETGGGFPTPFGIRPITHQPADGIDNCVLPRRLPLTFVTRAERISVPSGAGAERLNPSRAASGAMTPPAWGTADARFPVAVATAAGTVEDASVAPPSDRSSVTGVPAPVKNTAPPPVTAFTKSPTADWSIATAPPGALLNLKSDVPVGVDVPGKPAVRETVMNPARSPNGVASTQARLTPAATIPHLDRTIPVPLPWE